MWIVSQKELRAIGRIVRASILQDMPKGHGQIVWIVKNSVDSLAKKTCEPLEE